MDGSAFTYQFKQENLVDLVATIQVPLSNHTNLIFLLKLVGERTTIHFIRRFICFCQTGIFLMNFARNQLSMVIGPILIKGPISPLPQGSILGPILFNLYFQETELLAKSHDFNIHLYTDDMQCYFGVD